MSAEANMGKLCRCKSNEVKYIVLQFYLFGVRLLVVGGIFCHRSLSAILRKKLGKPKEEIGNLNGFEYMYLSDLKVP